MSLSSENELAVRRAVCEKLADVSNIGIVLPAPIYFAEKADFWANLAPLVNRKDIETSIVKLCAVYPLLFEDDAAAGGLDEPLTFLTYEFYIFHERSFERGDESPVADAFNKTLLKTHSEFVAVWLDVRRAFLGKQYLTGLADEIFAVKQTNSASQSEFINNNAECEFVGGVRGFEVRLQLKAKILVRDC